MSLHTIKGYHFTEENILSLLEQINTYSEDSLYAQYVSNRIFIYNYKGEVIEYRYFTSPDYYPYIYIYNDIYKFNEDTGYNQTENKVDVNELAKDLVSNNLYKIEQKFEKIKEGYDNIVSMINLYIE